jgi:hypothetical protein
LVFFAPAATLLGVWNLITISTGRWPDAIPTAWIQACGDAQLVVWVTHLYGGRLPLRAFVELPSQPEDPHRFRG